MKDYKRLTERRETPLVMSMWAGDSKSLQVYNRLAELEDKIERGELIERTSEEYSAVRKQAVKEFAEKLKKKADPYNYEENYIDRSIMYTDIDDLVTEVCRE